MNSKIFQIISTHSANLLNNSVMRLDQEYSIEFSTEYVVLSNVFHLNGLVLIKILKNTY